VTLAERRIDWTYLRIQSGSQAAPNMFHRRVRMLMAPPIEAIALVNGSSSHASNAKH
jgi:hypothetical protein